MDKIKEYLDFIEINGLIKKVQICIEFEKHENKTYWVSVKAEIPELESFRGYDSIYGYNLNSNKIDVLVEKNNMVENAKKDLINEINREYNKLNEFFNKKEVV